MDIGFERRQLPVRHCAHEVRRSVVHAAHHAVAARDDRPAVAHARDRGGEEPAIAVGAVRIAVRHRNRVVLDKLRAVVFVVEPFEQLFQFVVHIKRGITESGRPTW